MESTETMENKESMKDYERELEASFRTINEGDVIKGTVIDVTDEEVTLDLKYYTQGIVKVEDLSEDPNFSVLDDVKIGDVMEATVVKVDDGHGNIRLSKKEANAVLAWDVLKQYKEDKKEIPVKITQTVKGGAVAYVEGIRGFIPASQLDISYVEDIDSYQGKKLTVRVTEVDQSKTKLILSAKEILKEKKKEEHDGLSGLVHISQISEFRIKKPSEVLKVGDKVKAKILNTNDGKISLSIKAAAEETGGTDDTAKEAEMYSSKETVGTSLGDLLKGLKID